MNIFERAKKLGLPLGQYVITGSGPLEALGIRKASDLDIAVTPELYEKLRASGLWREEEHYGKTFLEGDNVTVIPSLNWGEYPVTAKEAIESAMILQGVPFMNLEELKKFKTAMGREKDLNDIKMIDVYIRNENN